MDRPQPERNALLVNQDWGVPENSLSEEQAQEEGLILFKGRWVTREQYKVLKGRFHSYYHVRVVAKLFFFFGIIMFCWAAILTGVDGAEALMNIALLLGISLALCAIGFGLYRYRRWAYLPALGVLILCMPINYILWDLESPIIALALILVALFIMPSLYYLLRKPTRQIFLGRGSGTFGSVPTAFM